MENCSIEFLFSKTVAKYPEHSAIEYGTKSVNYYELDKKSDWVSTVIRLKELKKCSVIGVLIEDRSELIISILGILKSNCVFVPFDTTYPVKRLETIMRGIEFDLIITDQANYELVTSIFNSKQKQPEIICIEDIYREIPDYSLIDKPKAEHNPDDPIYIYFTSGSTGKPKGIVGKYQSLVHFIQWEISAFEITEGFRVSQLISPSFDAFLRDIFVPICTGGTICIPENIDIILTAEKLIEWIDKSRVNLIHCVPSVFKLFNTTTLTYDNYQNLKYVLMSGERINLKDLENWYHIFGKRIQLVNLYGPSETTMVKTYYCIHQEDLERDFIPIGKPMEGANILLFDEMMYQCEQGKVGEIYIQTRYRTLGYYQDEKATMEKFIPNPLSSDPEDLIYKTGDLGKLLPDGNVHFLGRKDYQVKIRGVRVELGEIEKHLLHQPKITEAVVIDHQDENGNTYLAAYLMADYELDINDLRSSLSLYLPDYMIPAYFTQLEKIPLTPNGKIDRKALSEFQIQTDVRKDYIAPRNQLEEKLAMIWSEVLGVKNVGVDDNFFALGGHSLNGGFLATKINQEFQVSLPLKILFKNPTLSE